MCNSNDNRKEEVTSIYDRVKIESKKKHIEEAEKRKNQMYYFVKDRVYWKDGHNPNAKS